MREEKFDGNREELGREILRMMEMEEEWGEVEGK
jgi:hypothetical protein